MKRLTRCVALCAVLVVVFGTAHSTTWYVHPDSALNSIQAGIDSSGGGDTVLVSPRFYVEDINLSGRNSVEIDRMHQGEKRPHFERIPIEDYVGIPSDVQDIPSILLPDTLGGLTAPRTMLFAQQTGKVYLIGDHGDCILVLSASHGERLRRIKIDGRPQRLEYNPLSNLIYCANFGSNTVAVVDGAADTIVTYIQAGGYPRGLALAPTVSKLYCANGEDSDVSVIEASSNVVLKRIRTGSWPQRLVYNHLMNEVYCANRGSNSVSVVDCEGDSVTETIAVGSDPLDLIWSSTTNKLFTANQMDNTMSVIDCSTRSVTATLPTGDWPTELTYDSTYGQVYCANRGCEYITVIDENTETVAASIHVDGHPEAVAWNSINGKVYCPTADDVVAVVNTSTNRVIRHVTVRDLPREVMWEPMYNRAWIGNTGAGNKPGYVVSMMSGETDNVIKEIITGMTPFAMVLGRRDDLMFAVNGYGKKHELPIIDCSANTVSRILDIGEGAYFLVYDSTDNRVFVSNSGSHTVSVVDAGDQSVISTIPVGQRPRKIIWNSRDNKIYCANFLSYSISVIDPVGCWVIETVPLGDVPFEMTWDGTHDKVYSANSSSVTIIDGETDEVISSIGIPRDIQGFLKPVVLNDVNGKVYVGNYSDNSVSIIDTESDSLIMSLSLPEENPYALEYNSDRNKVYCACHWGPAITVISGDGNQITNTIPLPSGPYSLLYNPHTEKLYCACVKIYEWIEQLVIIDCVTEEIDSVISIESHPASFGAGTMPRYSLVLSPREGCVYMANYYDSKISIFAFSPTGITDSVEPATHANVRILPNPFQKSVSIQYSVTQLQEVGIDIYDSAGRHVICLLDRVHSPGGYRVIWNRETRYGNKVASGTYFLRLEAGDYTATKKMVVVR